MHVSLEDKYEVKIRISKQVAVFARYFRYRYTINIVWSPNIHDRPSATHADINDS